MERNAGIVRRVVENIWNRGELGLADRLFSAAYVNHGGLITDLVYGPEAIKVSVALFRTAFPELSITIERLTADQDKVELCWAAERTSRYMSVSGKPGTGPGRLTGKTVSTLADGKIVESWTDWDHAGALRQLEAIPMKTQA